MSAYWFDDRSCVLIPGRTNAPDTQHPCAESVQQSYNLTLTRKHLNHEFDRGGRCGSETESDRKTITIGGIQAKGRGSAPTRPTSNSVDSVLLCIWNHDFNGTQSVSVGARSRRCSFSRTDGNEPMGPIIFFLAPTCLRKLELHECNGSITAVRAHIRRSCPIERNIFLWYTSFVPVRRVGKSENVTLLALSLSSVNA